MAMVGYIYMYCTSYVQVHPHAVYILDCACTKILAVLNLAI